ncbi:MAG: hypothetical protein K1X74_01790 [Pirellulales bacterium]|nr:hypothetical protein [Pirellulales bacterium]
MDFQQRLEKAVQRGTRANEEEMRRAQQNAASLEEARGLHTKFRLELSEQIEACLRQVAHHFPGFQFATLVSDLGWGAKITRDDFGPADGGKRGNYFSRLEMAIRPFSEARVLELVAKGTIRNKEVFSRQQFQRLDEVDLTSFHSLIDFWTLEYAELYARQR